MITSLLTGSGYIRMIPDVAKERFEFWIEPEARKGLEAIRTREGVPVAEQIRRAIAAWLAERDATNRAAPRRVGARRKA